MTAAGRAPSSIKGGGAGREAAMHRPGCAALAAHPASRTLLGLPEHAPAHRWSAWLAYPGRFRGPNGLLGAARRCSARATPVSDSSTAAATNARRDSEEDSVTRRGDPCHLPASQPASPRAPSHLECPAECERDRRWQPPRLIALRCTALHRTDGADAVILSPVCFRPARVSGVVLPASSVAPCTRRQLPQTL